MVLMAHSSADIDAYCLEMTQQGHLKINIKARGRYIQLVALLYGNEAKSTFFILELFSDSHILFS